ncbi:MAG: isoprenyl transferase [Aquificota bacterium]|nr:MAG: isoprenyl transferase [Aquificota bacterium]
MNLKELGMEIIPRHVAIIMDGNGRWAKLREKPRVFGHRKGVERAKEASEFALEVGIEVLSLYAFSTENWARPKEEVEFLMALLEDYLDKELPTMVEKGIRFHPIGRIHELPESTQKKVLETARATEKNDKLILNLALNYGGRAELVDTIRSLAQKVLEGSLQPQEVQEKLVEEYLYTQGQPPPDLLIRTSGEYRISNFLLWQMAYTEFYFTPTLWPDFDRAEFLKALLDYQKRERRFGGVGD